VSGLPDKSEDSAIVNAVLSLAGALTTYLADHNCDDIQGYLLGKPMPKDQLYKALVAEQKAVIYKLN